MTPSETFHDHVQELRRRLLWIILAVGISAGVAYWLRLPLINILQKPLGAPLYYTSPAGSFNFVLKLSMIIGTFIALPMVVYQLLGFIRPALPIKLKKGKMIRVIASSFLLALAGIAFGFFIMIPMSLHFFGEYASAQIQPLISANEYLSFVTNNLILFALAFQIPLVILFINWIRPIKPGKLLRYQRHIIVGSFALALILPFTYDPISQFIVAIPIVFLYYLSALLLWIVNRKEKDKPAKHIAYVTPTIKQLPVFNPTAPQFAAPAQLTTQTRLAHARTTDGFLRHTSTKQTLKPDTVNAISPTQKTYAPKPAVMVQLPPRTFKRGLSLDGLLPT